jgi:hypothetical protein
VFISPSRPPNATSSGPGPPRRFMVSLSLFSAGQCPDLCH